MFALTKHIKVISNSTTTKKIKSEGQVKKVVFLISILLVCSTICPGQTKYSLQSNIRHEASVDWCAFYTPLFSNDFYGIYFDFKYYLFKRIATGIGFSWAEKSIDNTFSYSIGQPSIGYSEFIWINQYNIVQSNKIRIGFALNNGILSFILSDYSQATKVYNENHVEYIPEKVATNYFYLLQPGLDISLRIFSYDHKPDFYLTTKAKYNFVFGDCKYGKLSDFSNYYIAAGVSVIFSCGPSKK